MTDITYLEFRAQQGPIKRGEVLGEVESVKATSEIYSGIDGEIVAANQAVLDNPSLLNQDPFGAAWLLKIRPSNPGQLNELLASSDYDAKQGH